jgi:hypothetical protein
MMSLSDLQVEDPSIDLDAANTTKHDRTLRIKMRSDLRKNSRSHQEPIATRIRRRSSATSNVETFAFHPRPLKRLISTISTTASHARSRDNPDRPIATSNQAQLDHADPQYAPNVWPAAQQASSSNDPHALAPARASLASSQPFSPPQTTEKMCSFCRPYHPGDCGIQAARMSQGAADNGRPDSPTLLMR